MIFGQSETMHRLTAEEMVSEVGFYLSRWIF